MTSALRRLYGAAARSWARHYVRSNMDGLRAVQMHTLSGEQIAACLTALDLTVRRRTGKSAENFL